MAERMNESLVDDVIIFVFSYNRGQFLENCIQSIKSLASDCETIIIDDESTDPETIEVLHRAKAFFKVITPEEITTSEHKTGGLYNNMQLAITLTRKQNKKYAIFLQDDMQIVRSIGNGDVTRWSQFFKANPECMQIQSCFLKRWFYERDRKNISLDSTETAFFRSSSESAFEGFSSFSAVGIFNIDRLQTLYPHFHQGEHKNNWYATKAGIKMGLAKNPFMMWLPFPISNRGKKRNLPLQLIEALGQCGFYPYKYMSENDARRLKESPNSELPIAEEYLYTSASEISKCWSFAGGLSNLRVHEGFRRWLSKLLDYNQTKRAN